jgi:hypothetical protein
MRLNHAENGSGKPRIRALAKGATFRPVGFQDQCIQPLCHPSGWDQGYREAHRAGGDRAGAGGRADPMSVLAGPGQGRGDPLRARGLIGA